MIYHTIPSNRTSGPASQVRHAKQMNFGSSSGDVLQGLLAFSQHHSWVIYVILLACFIRLCYPCQSKRSCGSCGTQTSWTCFPDGTWEYRSDLAGRYLFGSIVRQHWDHERVDPESDGRDHAWEHGWEHGWEPVSYTHMTLPTKRIV